MTVLAPGVGAARDAHAASGLLLSALSAGSLLGALGYGALSAHGTLGARLAGFTAALALAFVAVGLFGDTIAGFALSAALTGLMLSPALTAGFVAIQRVSAPGSLAETFTWASFAAAAGAAACQALCGVLISGPGYPDSALATRHDQRDQSVKALSFHRNLLVQLMRPFRLASAPR